METSRLGFPVTKKGIRSRKKNNLRKERPINYRGGSSPGNVLPTLPVIVSTEIWTADPPVMYVYTTSDNGTFTAPKGVTNPVFTFPQANGLLQSKGTGFSSILYVSYTNTYYVAYEYTNTIGATVTSFGIAYATNLNGPWKWLVDVPIFIPGSGTSGFVAAPQWFVDDDGSIHIIATAGTSSNLYQPYIVDALNASLTHWSNPRVEIFINGVNYASSSIRDVFIVSPGQNPINSALYYMWYINGTSSNAIPYIELASSPTRNGPYTPIKQGDWLGIYAQSPTSIGWESVTVHPTPSGWTMYFVPSGPSGPWWYLTGTSWFNWSGTAIQSTGMLANSTSGSILLTV